MKYRFHSSFGCVGCEHTDELEFEEQPTEEELEEAMRDCVSNYLDCWYEKVDD